MLALATACVLDGRDVIPFRGCVAAPRDLRGFDDTRERAIKKITIFTSRLFSKQGSEANDEFCLK